MEQREKQEVKSFFQFGCETWTDVFVFIPFFSQTDWSPEDGQSRVCSIQRSVCEQKPIQTSRTQWWTWTIRHKVIRTAHEGSQLLIWDITMATYSGWQADFNLIFRWSGLTNPNNGDLDQLIYLQEFNTLHTHITYRCRKKAGKSFIFQRWFWLNVGFKSLKVNRNQLQRNQSLF